MFCRQEVGSSILPGSTGVTTLVACSYGDLWSLLAARGLHVSLHVRGRIDRSCRRQLAYGAAAIHLPPKQLTLVLLQGHR